MDSSLRCLSTHKSPVAISSTDDWYDTDEVRSMKEMADFFGMKVSKRDLYEATITQFDCLKY